ncbi:MAG: hypothetical protein GX238_09450 [Epulopiscium sp.]|nr:hypothetical protein [Candidatus Epulonipiscium sp.]
MVNIKRHPEYLKEQKKKYGLYTFITFLIMIANYTFGLWLTKTPKNIFTIIAVFFILGVAQVGVRLIIYIPYKDPNAKWFDEFKDLPNYYALWNSALITNGQKNAFFDSILIGDSKVYCLCQDTPKNPKKAEDVMTYIFQRKGLENSLYFAYGNQNIKELISNLKEKKIVDPSQQEEFIQILSQHSL